MPLLARNCTIRTVSAASFVADSVKSQGPLENRNVFNVRYDLFSTAVRNPFFVDISRTVQPRNTVVLLGDDAMKA